MRSEGLYIVFLAATVAWLLCSSAVAWAEQTTSPKHYQYQMVEWQLRADRDYPNPLMQRVTAKFTTPSGEEMVVDGFWNGGDTWRVRFMPLEVGEYSFTTEASNPDDGGLHQQSRTFTVVAAHGENPLHRHGGLLQVSDNARYLTYTDGTPFFWLGDTWWFCPSDLVPIHGSTHPDYASMYKTLIDTRSEQGYSIVQMAFLGADGVSNDSARNFFFALSPSVRERALSYWQGVDEYLAYANEAGIIPVIGLAFHAGMDQMSLALWTQLWRYVMARYGSYAVTWLITGEYNQHNVGDRVDKVLSLGQTIKDMDPYPRAMTVHPWYWGGDERQAWDQPWYDFIMLQGGHGRKGSPSRPPEQVYLQAYEHQPTKPFLESELNYEGIHGMDSDDVRPGAYRAMQLGSFGFTYGAHGLWYPTQSASDRRFSDWGEPIPWWEALFMPAGQQMQYLRSIYESVRWWQLEPAPEILHTRIPTDRILAQRDGDEVFLIYFAPSVSPVREAALVEISNSRYRGRWHNPRTGEVTAQPEWLVMEEGRLPLPERPGEGDWVLILKEEGQHEESDKVLLQGSR